MLDILPLYFNLDHKFRPTSTKSSRFETDDKHCIKTEVNRMLRDGIIRESTSPWRAQILNVDNEKHKKRLVVYYSRTINTFTRLDAYLYQKWTT